MELWSFLINFMKKLIFSWLVITYRKKDQKHNFPVKKFYMMTTALFI